MMKGGAISTWLAAIGVVTLVGCSATTGAEHAQPPTAEATSTGAERPPTAPADSLPVSEPAGESIYRIKNPATRTAIGTRVVLDGPSILVTATSATRVWIQEAGDDGGCEIGDGVVAYRGIVVTPRAVPERWAPGQRVRVEGLVAEVDGHRTLTDATIQPIGTPAYRYEPHCERDGDALRADALDAVLVITAGTTEGLAPGAASSAWSLTTCFGQGSREITVGTEMAPRDASAPGWKWVSGVMTRSPSGMRLEPRDDHDISTPHGDDACL